MRPMRRSWGRNPGEGRLRILTRLAACMRVVHGRLFAALGRFCKLRSVRIIDILAEDVLYLLHKRIKGSIGSGAINLTYQGSHRF